MKLPHYENAIVDQRKIVDYLLVSDDGKPAFYFSFGFTTTGWRVLAAALVRHAAEHEIESIREHSYGTNYTVVGTLAAPDGRMPTVRSVWVVRDSESFPRFVTAYPQSMEG